MKHLPNNIRVVLACLLLCVSQLSMAASADQEVSHLISFIEQSKATFIRNGDEHTSEEAAEHLAMKYRKAKRYAKTADDFIANLASKSSWSGKPYTVILADGSTLTANKWLTNELMLFRKTEKPQ
ncbi:YfeK family protein [Pseudoalteromonas prydzensis]|uniref:YfeK family protein n=1 Tax=Pseudoalteromonas prydzensis TaxID=182141 RepID=UPI00370462FD